MKKILLLTALCFTLQVKAQDFTQVKTTQDNIQLNLGKCHKEYKTGTILQITGMLIGGMGVALLSTDKESQEAAPLMYFGATFLTIGCVVHLDSHRFIGRAGR